MGRHPSRTERIAAATWEASPPSRVAQRVSRSTMTRLCSSGFHSAPGGSGRSTGHRRRTPRRPVLAPGPPIAFAASRQAGRRASSSPRAFGNRRSGITPGQVGRVSLGGIRSFVAWGGLSGTGAGPRGSVRRGCAPAGAPPRRLRVIPAGAGWRAGTWTTLCWSRPLDSWIQDTDLVVRHQVQVIGDLTATAQPWHGPPRGWFR